MKTHIIFIVLGICVLFLVSGCDSVQEAQKRSYTPYKIATATLDDWAHGTSVTAHCLREDYEIKMERIHQDYEGGLDGGIFHINDVEDSGVLEIGDSYTTNDGGLMLTVTDTIYQDYVGGIKTVTFDIFCK